MTDDTPATDRCATCDRPFGNTTLRVRADGGLHHLGCYYP